MIEYNFIYDRHFFFVWYSKYFNEIFNERSTYSCWPIYKLWKNLRQNKDEIVLDNFHYISYVTDRCRYLDFGRVITVMELPTVFIKCLWVITESYYVISYCCAPLKSGISVEHTNSTAICTRQANKHPYKNAKNKWQPKSQQTPR